MPGFLFEFSGPPTPGTPLESLWLDLSSLRSCGALKTLLFGTPGTANKNAITQLYLSVDAPDSDPADRTAIPFDAPQKGNNWNWPREWSANFAKVIITGLEDETSRVGLGVEYESDDEETQNGAFLNNLFRTSTVNTTIANKEQGILADMSVGNVTVTLPPATDAVTGQTHTVVRMGSGNTLLVAPDGADTINGVNASITLGAVSSGDGAAVILTREPGAKGWVTVSWQQLLDQNGAFLNNVAQSKSADYTMLHTDSGVVADTSGGNVAVTLPAAITGSRGEAHFLVRNGATNALTLVPNGADTINGVNAAVTIVSDQDAILVVKQGVTTWRIVSWTQRVGATQARVSTTTTKVLTPTMSVPIAVTAAGSQTIAIPTGTTYRFKGVSGFKTHGAGGAGDTLQVFAGATPVTNAIDLNLADKAVFGASTVDDAAMDFVGPVNVTVTAVQGGADCQCVATLDFIRIA